MNLKELAQRNIDREIQLPHLDTPTFEVDGKAFAWNPIVAGIDRTLTAKFARKELFWPNLRNSKAIACFSDYGGMHKDAAYKTFSFLLCDMGCIDPFCDTTDEIRKKHKIFDPRKEIAFKSFKAGPLIRMMPEYLKAADIIINGIVFTCAISNKIKSPLGIDTPALRSELKTRFDEAGISGYKDTVIEDLIIKVHVLAYLISISSNPGQRIFWMTDHDEIASNEHQIKSLLEFVQFSTGMYSKGKKLLDLGFALPFSGEGKRWYDLLSIPDIVAGSVEYALKRSHVSTDIVANSATNNVLKWLTYHSVGMKKYVVEFDQEKDGISACGIEFNSKDTVKDADKILIEM